MLAVLSKSQQRQGQIQQGPSRRKFKRVEIEAVLDADFAGTGKTFAETLAVITGVSRDNFLVADHLRTRSCLVIKTRDLNEHLQVVSRLKHRVSPNEDHRLVPLRVECDELRLGDRLTHPVFINARREAISISHVLTHRGFV